MSNMDAIIYFAEMVLGVESMDAHIAAKNEKSISLVKKLGFEFYGRTENYHFQGKDYLHYVFTRKGDATISCGNV